MLTLFTPFFYRNYMLFP